MRPSNQEAFDALLDYQFRQASLLHFNTGRQLLP
jgi:hypothetical protein